MPPKKASKKIVVTPSLSSQVTTILREEIVAGDLAPGELIAEIPTAARLGVSRLPVREATSILEREGLLVLEKRGRRRVRSLEVRDLWEIHDLRLALEPRLAALAAEFRSKEDLDALERNLENLRKACRLSQLSLLDLEFHDLIATASQHSLLKHMWCVMRGQVQLLIAALQRQGRRTYPEIHESTVRTHEEILNYIRIQDSQKAAAFVENNVRKWKVSVR